MKSGFTGYIFNKDVVSDSHEPEYEKGHANAWPLNLIITSELPFDDNDYLPHSGKLKMPELPISCDARSLC